MIPFALAALLALADSTVSGRVVDAVTHEPIAATTIRVVGTDRATLAADDGRFVIRAAQGEQLSAQRIGYLPRTVTVTGRSLEIMLDPAGHPLETVTISALRASPTDPVTQTTVQRAELERGYSGQETPMILTRSPAVTAYAEGGAFSNYSYVRLRGIDQTRINMTLDGIPLNDPEDEGFYFSNVPDFANSIESVQIQRGVGTSSNGTAAFGGAINFQSVALAAPRRGAEIQLTDGAFDTHRGSAEYHSGLQGRFAGYGRISGQNTAGYRHHSGNRSASGFFSGGWFGDRDIVKLLVLDGRARNRLAYLASSDSALAIDPKDNPLGPDERDDFGQRLAGLTWTHQATPTLGISTTLYGNNARGWYDVRIDTTLWNFNLRFNWLGGLSTLAWRRGPMSLDAGLTGSRYERSHLLFYRPDLEHAAYDNRGEKTEASTFAKASIDRGRATWFADLQARTAHFHYVPDANAGIPDRSTSWQFLNPRAGVRWNGRGAMSWYASVGTTGREPTRNDLFAGFDNLDTTNADFVGSLSRVRPERVVDTELGAAWRRGALELSADAYSMDFRNEIAAIGALSYIGLPLRKNVPRSWRRGAELEATWRPVSALDIGGNLAYAVGRIATYKDDASGTVYHDVEPLLSPRVTSNQHVIIGGSPLLGGIRPRLELTMNGRYVSRAYLANTNDRRFMTPASYLGDVGVAARTSAVGLAVEVRNVANARVYNSGYTDGERSYYYIQAGRNAIATLTLHW